eukprot:2045506-Prymnesium_polylepis.1
MGRPLQPLFRCEAAAAPSAEEAEARLGRGGRRLGARERARLAGLGPRGQPRLRLARARLAS